MITAYTTADRCSKYCTNVKVIFVQITLAVEQNANNTGQSTLLDQTPNIDCSTNYNWTGSLILLIKLDLVYDYIWDKQTVHACCRERANMHGTSSKFPSHCNNSRKQIMRAN